jgi:hypothetical protein
MGETVSPISSQQAATKSRRSKGLRQAVLTKALKAMQRAGIAVGRVKIDMSADVIELFPAANDTPQSENEWDSVK